MEGKAGLQVICSRMMANWSRRPYRRRCASFACATDRIRPEYIFSLPGYYGIVAMEPKPGIVSICATMRARMRSSGSGPVIAWTLSLTWSGGWTCRTARC